MQFHKTLFWMYSNIPYERQIINTSAMERTLGDAIREGTSCVEEQRLTCCAALFATLVACVNMQMRMMSSTQRDRSAPPAWFPYL